LQLQCKEKCQFNICIGLSLAFYPTESWHHPGPVASLIYWQVAGIKEILMKNFKEHF